MEISEFPVTESEFPGKSIGTSRMDVLSECKWEKVSSFWKKEKQLFGILTNYGRKWMLLEWSIECREAVYMEIEGNLEFKRVNLKSVNKTTEWTVQTTYIKCTWNWNNNVKNLIEIIFSIYTCNQDIE